MKTALSPMMFFLLLGSVNLWGQTGPPPRPAGLTLTAKTATSVSLTWNVAPEVGSVAEYVVFRDGVFVGTAPSNVFVCSGLEAEKAYTFRVRARDAAGNVSEASNALLATPQEAGLQSPPALVRTQFFAVVLNYNPKLYVNGELRPADQHYGHRNVDKLLFEYLELFRRASGGQMNWTVTRRFDLDEWPPGENSPSPVYDATNCVELHEQGYEYPAAYRTILHDPRFGIIPDANNGQLDAVWVFGAPGVGFAETAMAGPRPYWINGGETRDTALTRNIVFYGFGKAGWQGVGFMCENTCHMTEIILRDRIAPSWPLTVSNFSFNTLNFDNPDRALSSRPINDWTHFTQVEGISWDPGLVAPGSAQAGLSHFPPTALYNYDWSILRLDFNDPGPFHVYDGDWSIENGEYHVAPADGGKVLAFDGMELEDSRGKYHPAEAFSDGDVELTIRLGESTGPVHAGLLFRVAKCGARPYQVSGYYLGLDTFSDRLLLCKLDQALLVLTNAPCALEPNVTCRVRLEMRGNRINAYVNDALTPLISTTDTTFTTGGFGLITYGADARFDNLSIITHVTSTADKWYRYPESQAAPRDLSALEWDGDRDIAMDAFYAWWWEHLPKNGGAHYATNLATGAKSLLLNTWWPYVFDHNRFSTTRPYPDIIFPPEDITPPSAPSNLVGIALGPSRVGLAWTEPKDDVGVTRYTIFRDGAFLRKTTLPYVIDTRLAAGTTYQYTIQASDGSGNVSKPVTTTVTTQTAGSAALLLNGAFEFNPEVAGWLSEAFLSQDARFRWEPKGMGRHGSRCVSITATNSNDARWLQKVGSLIPGTQYWLTGWIKGTNVVRDPGCSIGVNLCLMGGWEHTPDYLDGNFDWRQFSMPFVASPAGEASIGCRLGFWGNCARGTVWFDDVAIIRADPLRVESPRLCPEGVFGFNLIATPGYHCQIEQTTDLNSWSVVQALDVEHPLTEISLALPTSRGCFYRVARVGGGAKAAD